MPIHSAHRKRHREPFPAPPAPAAYRNIAYAFVGVTVAIVAAALWFSSVRATVIVRAADEQTTLDASVEVARAPSQGQLPGRVVQGVFEQIREFDVKAGTGKAIDAVAVGKVKITNTGSAPQPLVRTTRLLTADGRLYRIDAAVNVPAKGSVDVEAYADKPGAQFEFSSKTRFTVPGLSESMQKIVTAESITPFQGGTRTVKALGQSDLDAAAKELEAIILEDAKKKLAADVGDIRFSESAYITKVIDTSSNVRVGEEAERFLFSLKLDVTGVFYAKTDMEALVKERLAQRVPEGRRITALDASSVKFGVSRANAAAEEATVTLTADARTSLDDKNPALSKDAILGLSIPEAERVLSEMDGIESAAITVRPAWVRRLPTLKDHITIRVE